MRLISTQFSLKTNSLDVYFGGCNGPHCKNCHNPESHALDSGSFITPNDLYTNVKEKFDSFPTLVKNIMIFGGEPLDQPLDELEEFLNLLKNLKIPVWLFTRHDVKDIPFGILIKCHYIKTGRYIEEELGNVEYYGITLSTLNQKILKRGIDY